MDNLTPTNRGEQFLDNILRTLNDENIEIELVAGNDDEKFLDDILKAAGGDEPLYNLTERWRHQWWLRKIAEAIANGGGGGGSSWELLASDECDVSTTSTTEAAVTTVELDVSSIELGDIFWVQIRDKAGKKDDYFYGSDVLFIIYKPSNSSATALAGFCFHCESGQYAAKTGALAGLYGIYPSALNLSLKTIDIKSRYSSSHTKTIDGTYKIDVYKLTAPDGVTMFE